MGEGTACAAEKMKKAVDFVSVVLENREKKDSLLIGDESHGCF